MLFTPMLLAHWLQLLSCVNHPSWDGSRVLTCFISDSTAAFYLELTHVLSILHNPCIHPVPLCCNEILFSPVVQLARDRTPVNDPFARNAEHEQGGFPLTTGCFLGRSRRLYSSNSEEFESTYSSPYLSPITLRFTMSSWFVATQTGSRLSQRRAMRYLAIPIADRKSASWRRYTSLQYH